MKDLIYILSKTWIFLSTAWLTIATVVVTILYPKFSGVSLGVLGGWILGFIIFSIYRTFIHPQKK